MGAQPQSPEPESLSEFDQWLSGFTEAVEESRSAMIEEGARLAKARFSDLVDFAEEEPEKAAKRVVDVKDWKGLPAAVREYLEKPFRGEGVLRAMVADDFERGVARYEWYLNFEGESYRVLPTGIENDLPINRTLDVEGCFIGRRVLLLKAEPRS